jgi:predicted nucleotidyltransferase
MCPYDEQIKKIKDQIIKKYNPEMIILFGSCAKGVVHKGSDIDICIIAQTNDKRKFISDILTKLEYDVDLEIVVYTPYEWQKYKDDDSTFAGVINRTGVKLFG